MSTSLSLGGFNESGPLRHCTLDELDIGRVEGSRERFLEPMQMPSRSHFGGHNREGRSKPPPNCRWTAVLWTVSPMGIPTVGGSLCSDSRSVYVRSGRVAPNRRRLAPDLLKGVLGFIAETTRTIDTPIGGQGSTQNPQSEYPFEGLRELVVNALVHRELKLTSRVAVMIFDDRLVVRSPGGPMFDAQLFDALANHGGRSIPRNPVLASMARRLGLCEQIGRGLVRARRLSAEITRAPLRIEATPADVSVTIPSALVSQVTN